MNKEGRPRSHSSNAGIVTRRGPGGVGNSLLEKEPGLADAIIASVELGLFDAQVAAKHGIGKETLFRWLDRGSAEDAEEPFLSFATKYNARCAEVEEAAVASIREAGEDAVDRGHAQLRGDWRATAWWLERWRPQRWGPKAITRDAWQQPAPTSRAARAVDVFAHPTPDLLKVIERAGKMLVDKPVVETTGEPAQSSQ